MKRPVCLFALCYLLLHFVWIAFFEKGTAFLPFEEGEKLCFVGKVDNKSVSSTGSTLYLTEIQMKEDVAQGNFDTGQEKDKEKTEYKGAICYMAQECSIPIQQLPKMGSYVMIEGIYKPFYKATNQGQFDQKSYYETQKIDFSIANAKVTKTTDEFNWFEENLWLLKYKWQKVYETICTEKEAGFLTSVILGDKKNLDLELKNLFSQNGIAHILAVSGVHLSILGMGLYQVLSKTGLPQWIRVIASIFVIIMYGIMIHAGVATFRAIIMLGIHMFGKLLGRTYDMAVATAVAACVIVTGNAGILTNSGFVLSFMAILSLLLFYPFVKRTFQLKGRLSQCKWIGKIWDSFFVSFSITFFLLPVQVYYYYEIYTYSIFLNLIVLPLFSIVLYFGFAGGVAGMVSPFLGRILLLPCKCIFQFYQWVCERTELLPANRILIGAPTMIQVVAFYLLVLGGIWASQHFFKENKEASKKSAGFCVAVCCMACIILCVKIRWNTRIIFLDVGQGDCCIIEHKSGINILIDAGSSDVTSCGERRVIPFLKSEGIGQIDYAFLSHPDSDHYSALVECMESESKGGIKVEQLVLSLYGKNNEEYEAIIETAKAAGCEQLYIKPGDVLTVGEGKDYSFSLRCLFPYGDEKFTDTNDQSMILYATEGDFTMLFTGDMSQVEENDFLDLYGNGQGRNPYGNVDLLKVAHHGSASSTSEEFLQCFTPQVAVISCGVNNTYGHPHRETLKRLNDAGSKVLTTAEYGAITIEVDKGMKVYGFIQKNQ